jgi:hypothetical protein
MKKEVIFRANDAALYDQLVNLSLTGQNGFDEIGTYSVTFDRDRAAKHYINADLIWDDEDEAMYNDNPNLVGGKLIRLHCNDIEDGQTELRSGFLLLTANIVKILDPNYNAEIEVLEKDSENAVHRSLYLFQKQSNSKAYNYYYIKNLE